MQHQDAKERRKLETRVGSDYLGNFSRFEVQIRETRGVCNPTGLTPDGRY